MSEPIIEIENLSKLYRLGTIGYGTLRASLSRWWGGHNEDVELPPGIDPSQAGPHPNTFWALKDISATIYPGEIAGIIGRNGAGKSTLLKILSRITEPTRGRAILNGRTGSLLEVGAGFHGELTGRDNIFLNGAILGMKKSDIARQLDDIISFAGIGGFIDTPVKRYSSGMYVRLAFAVAAHLEPDILIVDEVLAVGDARFQQRCLGRMKDISSEHGRTVLFVSHNLEAVQRLCSHCYLLDQGRLRSAGDTQSVVAEYLADGAAVASADSWIDISGAPRRGNGDARFAGVRFTSGNAVTANRPYPNGPLEIALAIDAAVTTRVQSIAIGIRDDLGRKLVNADTGAFGHTITLPEGRTVLRLRINHLHLRPGVYGLALWMARYAGERIGTGDVVDFIEKAVDLEVVDASTRGFRTSLGHTGVVPCEFEVVDISHPETLRDSLTSAAI